MSAMQEQRVCIKFCLKLGKTFSETYELLTEAFGDTTMGYSRCYHWYRLFTRRRTSVEDAVSGRPSTTTSTGDADTSQGAGDLSNEPDIGEVKLEPELVGIKEEPTNDSTDECQCLPVEIKEEPQVNIPSDGGTQQTSSWSPNDVKEEWVDGVTVEEMDVDPLANCFDTGKKFEASKCSKSRKEFLGMSQEIGKKKPHLRFVRGSAFAQKKQLNRHVCDVCGKGFRQSHNLFVHKRTHTGEKPYVCDICGKGYTIRFHLKYHFMTHTGERPYVCDVCGKGFIRNTSLTAHMRTHTGEKPYVCDICGSRFTTGCSLKKHMKLHTGERPYVCDICGKGYTISIHLKYHYMTHTGERPHVCNICGKGFTMGSILKTHMKIHTREKPCV